MQAYERHAYERHAYERHAYERHAYEMAYGICTPNEMAYGTPKYQTTRMFSDTWDSRLTAGLMARGSEMGVREGVPREWLAQGHLAKPNGLAAGLRLCY